MITMTATMIQIVRVMMAINILMIMMITTKTIIKSITKTATTLMITQI